MKLSPVVRFSGPADQRVRPAAAQPRLLVGAQHRIAGRGTPVADHRPAVIFQAHLPEHVVAAEEGHVPTALDEAVHGVPHPPRPVLVVADAHHQLVAIQHLGVELEVAVDREVESVAVRLCPAHEASLPVPPPGGGAPHRHVEAVEIGRESPVVGVAIGFGGGEAAVVPVVLDRLDDIPRLEGAVEGHVRRPRVEAFAAPLVVGVVGVGAQHQHRSRTVRRSARADHEAGVARRPDLAIRLQGELVEA